MMRSRWFPFLACLIPVSAISCDTFGLPAYRAPEEHHSSENADILDINPKYGRIGEETTINIKGINTSFTDSTIVEFPDEPEIEVRNIRLLGVTELDVTLVIGIRAVPGVHGLFVITDSDGTMEYAPGFTLVE